MSRLQYLILILFIPLSAILAEIYAGMSLVQQIEFQNQNQNQNQNYTLRLKTDIFCERWSHCEKLCSTNLVQPQSTVAFYQKLCEKGNPYHQKNI